MKYAVLILALFLTVGCGRTEQNGNDSQSGADEQTGSSAAMVSADVIGSDMGYIVENARIVSDDAPAAYSIKGKVKLAEGTGQVLIVRTQTGGFTELLAVGFPEFVTGARFDVTAGTPDAGYWIFGINGEEEILRQTGMVEGTLRFVKRESAEDALGLSRDVENGVGEIEVVVTGIDNSGTAVEAEKKYAARYRLPFISIDELARINQPI